MKTRNSLIFNCIAVLLISSVVLLTGCDSKSPSTTSGEENIAVSVSATPSQVDVYSSVVVEAEVLNGTTPVANKDVRFTVSPSVAGSFSDDTVMTDENGLAATIFYPSIEGDVTITANTTAGLSTSNASTEVRITSGGGPGIGTTGIISSIYLSADSMNLVVKSTGGIESATLRAVGLDIEGNSVPEGTSISFYITAGPGGGEHLDTLGYGPVVVETDGYGEATVVLHSGTRPGTIRIRAMANDTVLSNATQILVSAGPPKYIALASSVCNANFWNTAGEFVNIIGVVSDTFHNPVNDSTLVYFSTDEGTMVSHHVRTQDLEGIVTTDWISGYASNSIPTPDGKVIVMAETAGGIVADTIMFINSGLLDSIIAFGVPNSIEADGKTEAVVNIYGWDVNTNPVVDGSEFNGSGLKLDVPDGVFEYVCGALASWAEVTITSVKLERDYSMLGGNDDGIGFVDTVKFYKYGAYWEQQVYLTTGPAYKANSSVGGASSIRVGETAEIDAKINDRWGNPLGDHTLVATYPSGGTPGPGTVRTNTYGEAFGFQWTPSPADTGKFLITITDTDPRGGVSLSTSITVSP